jgi:hypothetical protein
MVPSPGWIPDSARDVLSKPYGAGRRGAGSQATGMQVLNGTGC